MIIPKSSKLLVAVQKSDQKIKFQLSVHSGVKLDDPEIFCCVHPRKQKGMKD